MRWYWAFCVCMEAGWLAWAVSIEWWWLVAYHAVFAVFFIALATVHEARRDR